MDDPIILSVDDVIALHDVALTLGDGGCEGIRSYHALSSAAAQPFQSVFGQDAYTTIPEKAAALAFFIAESQAFIDGNKRTGALAATVFLDLNGYDLHEDGETAFADVLISVGSGKIDQEEFFEWMCNHARRRKPA